MAHDDCSTRRQQGVAVRAALGSRGDWWGIDDVAYLYTGAHAPTLVAAREAMNRAYEAQSRGPAGRAELYEAEKRSQSVIGTFAGVGPESVAFVGDTSTAWNVVAHGLRWSPGDNVVMTDLEHPASVYPFLRLKDRGLQSRVVARDKDGRVRPAAIEAAIDDRTTAITVTHVAYVNGYRHDIGALAEIADRHHIPLFVDWSHSLGVVPIDMSACAIGLSASYKWLLGPYGVGIVLWNRERYPDFVPGAAGWRTATNPFTPERFTSIPLEPDAVRFRLGAPSFAGIAALGASAGYLHSLGPATVTDHALALVGLCLDGFRVRGLEVLTPTKDDEHAGNAAFAHPQGGTIADMLAERGVYVWGGDRRVRVSCHVMTSEAHIDRLFVELDDVLRRL